MITGVKAFEYKILKNDIEHPSAQDDEQCDCSKEDTDELPGHYFLQHRCFW